MKEWTREPFVVAMTIRKISAHKEWCAYQVHTPADWPTWLSMTNLTLLRLADSRSIDSQDASEAPTSLSCMIRTSSEDIPMISEEKYEIWT